MSEANAVLWQGNGSTSDFAPLDSFLHFGDASGLRCEYQKEGACLDNR
jgi:hypothetical protein